jgi:hypothetical protein
MNHIIESIEICYFLTNESKRFIKDIKNTPDIMRIIFFSKKEISIPITSIIEKHPIVLYYSPKKITNYTAHIFTTDYNKNDSYTINAIDSFYKRILMTYNDISSFAIILPEDNAIRKIISFKGDNILFFTEFNYKELSVIPWDCVKAEEGEEED